ncbi:MAG: RDD family protein [SAR324 cluster bacterium]|nr:RDD family protein [SAR324 cluster bacterium]
MPSTTLPSQKLKIASHGKRLFALILDFAFALLLVNTANHLRYDEHWDLTTSPSQTWTSLVPVYLSILILLILKDLTNGCSPGKFIFGLTTRQLEDLSQSPPAWKNVLRNVSLCIFPIESVVLLMNSHGLRLGDQLFQTVVIENPKARRFLIRVMAANTIFFGYFFSALLIQPLVLNKTAAYQTAVSAIQNSPEVAKKLGAIQEFESPEMDMNIQEQEGHVIMRMTVIGKDQSFPITVSMKLSTMPERSWQLENLTIGGEESSN